MHIIELYIMHFSLRIGHSSVIILLWKGQPQKDQHERLFGDDGTSSACVEEGAGPALDYQDGTCPNTWNTSQTQNKEASFRDASLPKPFWGLTKPHSSNLFVTSLDRNEDSERLFHWENWSQAKQTPLSSRKRAPGHDASGMPRHKALTSWDVSRYVTYPEVT